MYDKILQNKFCFKSWFVTGLVKNLLSRTPQHHSWITGCSSFFFWPIHNCTYVKYTLPRALDGAVHTRVANCFSRGSAWVIALHSAWDFVFGVFVHVPIHSFVLASRAWMKKPLKISPSIFTAKTSYKNKSFHKKIVKLNFFLNFFKNFQGMNQNLTWK